MIKNIFKRRADIKQTDTQTYWSLLLKAELAGDIKDAIGKRSAKLEGHTGDNAHIAIVKEAHKALEALDISLPNESDMAKLTAIVDKLGTTEEQMQRDRERLVTLCAYAEEYLQKDVYNAATAKAKAEYLIAEANLKNSQTAYQLAKEQWDECFNRSSGGNEGINHISGDYPAHTAVRAMYKL